MTGGRLGLRTGYLTSICASGRLSVNHLTVIDQTLSPNATFSAANGSKASDNSTISGIGPGSSILFLLYSGSGGCYSDEEHLAMFQVKGRPHFKTVVGKTAVARLLFALNL